MTAYLNYLIGIGTGTWYYWKNNEATRERVLRFQHLKDTIEIAELPNVDRAFRARHIQSIIQGTGSYTDKSGQIYTSWADYNDFLKEYDSLLELSDKSASRQKFYFLAAAAILLVYIGWSAFISNK
jgi:hypothetical protein